MTSAKVIRTLFGRAMYNEKSFLSRSLLSAGAHCHLSDQHSRSAAARAETKVIEKITIVDPDKLKEVLTESEQSSQRFSAY